MNIEKHIAHWRAGSEEDFQVAQELLEKGRFRHALFFAHLAVEKMLKARVVRVSQDVPPKIHNLIRLLDLSGLRATGDQTAFLHRLNAYQLVGRYPDCAGEVEVGVKHANELMIDTRRMLEWLTTQL